jgi:hypothetical protein
MRKQKTEGFREKVMRLIGSIWLFPLICTIVLLGLTAFKISGSSIGVYNDILYGPAHKDSSLIFNKPRSIRSDEWVWNSQMIMAQANNHFGRINPNLGHGQDMSLIIDVPYKDWSAIFRPQNLAFFILPFQYAFAFKWWLMAFLLLLSCYFFILFLLPRKRFLAAAISLALLFSPFVQWWYQYITLAPLYYSLFALLAFMCLLREKNHRKQIVLGLLLAYLLVCFGLVLYPPFQISCALAALAFAIGFLLNQRQLLPDRELLRRLLLVFGSLTLAGIIVLGFVHTRSAAVHSIENTTYPGRRVEKSGGYDVAHLFSGHLDFQLQYTSRADHYQIPKNGLTNQSEDSNFLLLLPFLLVPSIYILYINHKAKLNRDWTLIFVNLAFLGALVWLFLPHLELLGKASFLYKVPQNRLIIGLGLLNILQLVIFIKALAELKRRLPSRWILATYSGLIFISELILAIHAKNSYPLYIGLYRSIAFSVPVPVIIYLLLTKRFGLAAVGLLAFNLFMTVGVNPLYRGTDIITNSKISTDIKSIASKDKSTWAVEDAYLENFALLNGARSLTGVYSYPQLGIWRQILGANPSIYNRYAHVSFNFYRDDAQNLPTQVQLAGGDHFGVFTEPCSSFLRNNNVHFLVTDVPLNEQNNCLQVADIVKYPARSIYIYHVH